MSAIQATDETFDPFVLIHQSVTARLQIVEVELEMAETKSRELEASLEQVRDQAEESRVVEKHLLNNLKQFSPSEVQETFANIRETQLSLERVQLEYEFLTARRAELKDQGQFLRSASQILADLQRMYGENGSPPTAAEGDKQFRDASRQLIFDLRPMTLDDLGLVPTLRKFIKEYGDRYGLATRFNVVGQERRLPGNTEGVLFRIIQEALTNVHKNKNLGLLSMRERAELEKGTLEIRSQPGRGTEVKVEIALPKR